MPPSLKDHAQFLAWLTPPANIPGLRHFNPALARWRGYTVICWRVEDAAGMSRLAIGQLNGDKAISKGGTIEEHAIHSAQMLDIPCSIGSQVVDPRLCDVDGTLWLNYGMIEAGQIPRMEFVRLALVKKKWKITEGPVMPAAFGNGGGKTVVKNWIPFADQNSLCFLNGPSFGGSGIVGCPGISQSQRITHPLGTVSGRSNALKVGNELLALVGGWREHPTRRKQYWFAAMTWHEETLEPLRFSEQVLAWAGEGDDFIPCPRDPQYNPLCLFPSGLMQMPDDEDEFLVSVGVNDSSMALMKFNIDDFKLVLLPEIGDVRQLAGDEALADDLVKVRVACKHPIGENGFTYHPGEVFTVPKDRYAALGAFVEVVPLLPS